MQNLRLWIASIMGLVAACGGVDFTFDSDGGGGGAGGGTSTSTTASTGTTGITTSTTTGAGGVSTSSTSTTGGGMGGAATTGASGAGGKAGGGGQGGATGGRGGAMGSGGGGRAGAAGSGGAGMGGTGMGGTGTGGSGGTSVADAGPDASVDCSALRADLDAKLAAAQKCDPQAMKQCQDVVAGVCCPAPINSKSSPEGMAYLAAFDRYKAAQCRAICPLIACRAGTPTCLASASGPGQCVLTTLPPPI
jgi:hypothetical protein